MEVDSGNGMMEVGEESTENINPEYASQFFGFTPYSVFDEIFNIALDYVKDAVRVAHNYLSIKLHYIPKDQLRKGSENITKVAVEAFEKNVNKLEVFQLKNVFHVPDHIVLPEDSVHQDKIIAATKERELDMEIEDLRNQISSSISRIAKRRSRNDDLDRIIKKYRKQANTFAEMDECLKAAGGAKLSKSLEEAKSSTQALNLILSQES